MRLRNRPRRGDERRGQSFAWLPVVAHDGEKDYWIWLESYSWRKTFRVGEDAGARWEIERWRVK